MDQLLLPQSAAGSGVQGVFQVVDALGLQRGLQRPLGGGWEVALVALVALIFWDSADFGFQNTT